MTGGLAYSVLWYSTENIGTNECSSRGMRGNELVLWEDLLLDLILNFSRKQYVLCESCQLLYLYIYIGIVLFFYCFIVCLQHWGITFFISIFYFCPLLRPLFFMIVVAASLSFGFLRCKGMAVLSDTKHQAKPYSAKTFPERLPQMLLIWVFPKTFYRIVWCSDS